MTLSRRTLLAASAAALLPLGRVAGADAPLLKAAVIGHTGRGDYGHGMDVCFTDVPRVEVVAVADPVEAGRAKAATKAKAARQYADYRQMLETEKPDLVSVAPRWSERHKELAVAALSAGAHVYMEKPFAVSPAEGDEILAAAAKHKRRIAVAHQMRLAPSVVFLKQRVDGGLLGDLLEMRAYGKQDARAGGEDLLVLGVHLFDLMRLFAGDPQWCTARVTQQGREVTKADARAVKEMIGPVAGDEVTAQFAFAGGVTGGFTSRGRLRDRSGWWGLELVGSKASARILADIWPSVAVLQHAPWTAGTREERWTAIEGDPGRVPGVDKSNATANRRLVDDLLAAVREGREPACSGRNAAWG
ncbi:MAG TPA: Gfo/Idh/MocA family oxidoreductase, partial [Humisphaera sp.]